MNLMLAYGLSWPRKLLSIIGRVGRSARKRAVRVRIRRGGLLVTALCLAAPAGFAQQITRFAVVDMTRIFAGMNIRTNAYAELERKTAQVQAELDKRRLEIDDIQAKIVELQQKIEAEREAEAAAAEDAPPPEAGGRTPARGRAAPPRQTPEAELARMRGDIVKKSEALKDYYQKKTAELEAERSHAAAASVNAEALALINAQITLTAESEGYTMVLDKGLKGIVWYSRSVDITDKVIAALNAKAKR